MEKHECKCKRCGKTYYINLDSFEMKRQDDMDADFYQRKDEIINLCPKCRPKTRSFEDIVSGN